MIYMAPKTSPFFNDPLTYGCIFSTAKQVGGQLDALKAGCWWIFENARFTNNQPLTQSTRGPPQETKGSSASIYFHQATTRTSRLAEEQHQQ